MPIPVTRTLAAWASACRYEDLPKTSIVAAKRQLLDTLACAWAGSDAAGIEGVRSLLIDRGGKRESQTWVFADHLPAPAAARLNGMMAAALDYDCLHDTATAHPGIVVLPAVLAMAERLGSPPRDVLTAAIVGNEVILRLCGSMQTRPGWFYTSALGGFAAAAACANLLRLDAKTTAHAFGIALCSAAGTGQALIEKTLTKRLQSALAAEAGVEAALMAAKGVTGPAEALEGTAGFFSLYSRADEQAATRALGEAFLIEELTYKKYPSCFFNHAAIEATLDLLAKHNLHVEDVASAEVRVSQPAAKFVGAEFEPGETPQVAAQFSLKYSIAAVLLYRRFGLSEIDPAAICDPRIPSIARKVEVVSDGDVSTRFVPVDVALQMTSGQRYAACVETLPGTPQKPLSDVDFSAKALDCFSRGVRPLSAQQIEALTGRIMTFEDSESIGALYADLPALPYGQAA